MDVSNKGDLVIIYICGKLVRSVSMCVEISCRLSNVLVGVYKLNNKRVFYSFSYKNPDLATDHIENFSPSYLFLHYSFPIYI